MNIMNFKNTNYNKGLIEFYISKIGVMVLLFLLTYLFSDELLGVIVIAAICLISILGALLYPHNGNIFKSFDGERRPVWFVLIEIICFLGTILSLVAHSIIVKNNKIDNLYTKKEYDSERFFTLLLCNAYDAKTPEKCLSLLSLAADLGNTKAMEQIAYGYSEVANENPINNKHFGVNLEKEIEWLEKAISYGSVSAMLSLALTYTINHDDEKAITLYNKAISSSWATDIELVKAYKGIGEIYSYRTSIEKKPERELAIAYYEKPILKMSYRISDSDIGSHEYYRLREEVASCAWSLSTEYKKMYGSDPAKGSKIAGMLIYAMILNPDLKEYIEKSLEELPYPFSGEQISKQQKAAMHLTYTLF